MPENTIDDLDALFAVLPPTLRETLAAFKDREQILEIVMDLGRLPEARFPAREVVLSNDPRFDPRHTRAFLNSLDPVRVDQIGQTEEPE